MRRNSGKGDLMPGIKFWTDDAADFFRFELNRLQLFARQGCNRYDPAAAHNDIHRLMNLPVILDSYVAQENPDKPFLPGKCSCG